MGEEDWKRDFRINEFQDIYRMSRKDYDAFLLQHPYPTNPKRVSANDIRARNDATGDPGWYYLWDARLRSPVLTLVVRIQDGLVYYYEFPQGRVRPTYGTLNDRQFVEPKGLRKTLETAMAVSQVVPPGITPNVMEFLLPKQDAKKLRDPALTRQAMADKKRRDTSRAELPGAEEAAVGRGRRRSRRHRKTRRRNRFT